MGGVDAAVMLLVLMAAFTLIALQPLPWTQLTRDGPSCSRRHHQNGEREQRQRQQQRQQQRQRQTRQRQTQWPLQPQSSSGQLMRDCKVRAHGHGLLLSKQEKQQKLALLQQEQQVGELPAPTQCEGS